MKFQVGKISADWAERSQIPVWYAPVVTSTNLIAKDQDVGPAPISLFIAEQQTAGRGRGENTWTSAEAGSQFLCSWVFQMSKAPQPVLAPAIGLAIWTSLKATFPWLDLSLKAPNDIYLGDRKIAGILLENVQQGQAHRLVIGLGINVWSSPADISTSTSLASGKLENELSESTWFNILDRLLLELSLAVSQTRVELSDQQRHSLKHCLNLYPKLSQHVQKVEADGSLLFSDRKINWSEL